MSFTSDIWISSVSPMSLISFAANHLTAISGLMRILLRGEPSDLRAKHFRGAHTSAAIAGMFDDMLQTWGIPESSVHVVLRDQSHV